MQVLAEKKFFFFEYTDFFKKVKKYELAFQYVNIVITNMK